MPSPQASRSCRLWLRDVRLTVACTTHARTRPIKAGASVASGKLSYVKKYVDVVGAVIQRDGLVLCTQRGSGHLAGKWEFPGGKIEAGESPRGALEREIREELLCDVKVGDVVTTTTHEYDFAVITLTTFYGELVGGEPELTEHADARWLPPADLDSLDWAPADVPAVAKIREHFGDAP